MGKRILLILLPITVALALVFGIYQGVKPRIQSWLLSQVNRLSEEKLPVHLTIEKVDWGFFFPEIILQGVEIRPKNFPFPPLKIREITASLDLLAITGGKIAISTLLLDQLQAEANLDLYFKDSKETSKPLPLKDLFQTLKRLPVARFGIRKGLIDIESQRMNFKLRSSSVDLLLNLSKDRLGIQLDLNHSNISFGKAGEIPFRLQGEALMTASTLDISSLKLGALNSFISAKGAIADLPNVQISPKGTIEFEAFSELTQLAGAAKSLLQFPDMSGQINSSGRIDLISKEQINSGFKFSGRKLKVSNFDIGDVQFQGEFRNGQLKIPKLALTNEAGLVDVTGLQIDLKGFRENEMEMQAQVQTEQVDIHELLQSLGLGDLPLEIFIGTNLQCSGPIGPQVNIRCDGKALAQQLEIGSGSRYKEPIVQIDEFSAEGGFNVTGHGVSYQASLSVGEDKGESSGNINYKTGFKINYSSPKFDLKNIRKLANLKLEGSGELQGSTEGDSKAATFNIKMKTKDIYFEDFFLGSPTGMVSYEKGILRFSNLEAHFPSTHYLANVDVDLNKKKLKASGQMPKFEISELLSIFQRRFQMPVEVAGTGMAAFDVEGPFRLGELSYNLNANLNRGSIVGESFDKIELNLHADSGQMRVQKALLTKNKNQIRVTGSSDPQGDIDLKIDGPSIPLEESENISRLGGQISGLLDVTASLKGHVLKPEVRIGGRIHDLFLDEQEFKDSTFNFLFSDQSMKGEALLIGGQLEAKFTLPLTEISPFHLNLRAKDWNYTTLFALFGGGNLLNEYRALLTGDLELASERGGFWAATGQGAISDFLLQRGGLSLRNLLPMEMKMRDGLISLRNFRVDGDQTFFEFKGKRISERDLGIHVEAQANLRLFQIFLPFLEELAGRATVTADLSGPLLKPEILGNGNVRNGFAKIKGFPHPFEKTQADIQFSQSKILINGFLGNMAGGAFEGDGNILIEGPRNLPTTINAHLEGVNFNVPDRVRTSGSADVVFSGSWFPFTLSGTYHVDGGFVDKELSEENTENTLKQSSYLPRLILQSAFEPVLLDLRIILEKPLAIRNSMVDGAVNGAIQVRGAPTDPVLSGQLTSEKGTKAIFRDKVFDIQTANIRFTSADQIDPELYVSARSRISEHDIGMLIQGTAKNPLIKLSSVPPLSEADIISLIALGVTSEGLERQQQEAQQARDSAAGGIAANVLTQLELVRKFQKNTGLEIQVSNSFDDTRKVSVQKVTLSKKISDKVRASATKTSSRALNTDEYTLQYNFTENISAIGRYEDRKPSENAGSFESVVRENQSILGIDLEFKKEFK